MFNQKKLARYNVKRGHFRKKVGIPRKAPVVGMVSRFSEVKRPLLFLEIAARIRKIMPEAHFLILGGGVLQEKVESRASQADLKDAVHFANNENDAMRVMVEMDVFLLTSRIEGLPNVLIEAQALGVPVVTMPVGGAAEALDHSCTGIVLEGSESEKVAEVIVNLLHDEAWMANARQVAPEFVKQAFCIEKVIDKILAVYDVTENRDECASGNCVVAEEPQRNDD